MVYRGFIIEAVYWGFAWYDPEACTPLNQPCVTEEDAKEEIDEHIELGRESPYTTDKDEI